MDHYDPNTAPQPEAWLELSESERIDLAMAAHVDGDEEEPEAGFHVHAIFHTIVETRIAEGDRDVINAMRRLTDQGLPRHDAVHAVAFVLSEEIHAVSQGQAPFNPKRNRRRLEKLTAKRVLKGKC